MNSYIPRDYVTTADAVDRVFSARHPELAASVPAMNAEMRRLYSKIDTVISRAGVIVALSNLGARHLKHGQSLGMISSEDVARLRELDGIASEAKRLHSEAAIELRTALAEGDLVAVLNYEEMPQVKRFRWREDDGLAIVLKGRLSSQVEGALTQFRECLVVVNEADLMGWLSSSLQAGSEKTEQEATIEKSEKAKRNGRGPRPERRLAITARMISDYAGSPDVLAVEKQVYLASTYSAARSTVEKARHVALGKLRGNRDK